jgi:hypothetical protein
MAALYAFEQAAEKFVNAPLLAAWRLFQPPPGPDTD